MKKPKHDNSTGARGVVTKSCSLYFHYSPCILKYFLSLVASLLIAFHHGVAHSFSPGGFNYMNQSRGERTQHPTGLLPVSQPLSSDSPAGTAHHSGFQVSLCSLPWKGIRCLLSVLLCPCGSLKYFFFCPRVIMATIASS